MRALIWTVVILLCSITPTACLALTPGREWTITETLGSSTEYVIWTPRFEVTADGVPYLSGGAWSNGVFDVYGFAWNGTAWVRTWNIGRGLNFSWPVWAPADEFWAVGQDPAADPDGRAWFWLAKQIGSSFEIENIVRAPEYVTDFSAAVSSQRKWLLFNDNSLGVRMFFSDHDGTWTEVSTGGQGGRGLGIAALDETTAILAWIGGGSEGLRWGTHQGSTFLPGSQLGSGISGNPSFRRRPSGGLWLGYASGLSYSLVRHYQDGLWSEPKVVSGKWRLKPGTTQEPRTNSFDLSRDTFEYPALTWSAFDSNRGVNTVVASVPTDTGWTTASQLIDDDEGGLPTVARDFNGDVWVAFWRYSRNGIFWAHTYTKAMSTIPSVVADHSRRIVSWTLSEPSPETWWTVLRGPLGGTHLPIARVRAGSTPQMSWIDENPPAEPVSYRIRRDCLDARYEWTSGPSDEPVPALPSLVSASARPGTASLTWFASEISSGIIHRRSPTTDWQTLGNALSQGNGLLTYEDTKVPAGSYAYRLKYGANDEDVTAETWIDVPSAFKLAMHGLAPNPALRDLKIHFTLAAEDEAVLEILDVAGRRVYEQNLTGLTPGNHQIPVETSEQLSPGVYWLRVIQGGTIATKRGVVIR